MTALVYASNEKYHSSHTNHCHTKKLVTNPQTGPNRADHFLQADDKENITLGFLNLSSLVAYEDAPELCSSISRCEFYQCFSLISTVLTSTPSLNHRSSSLILTSFVLFCLFLIRPLSAKVQSSRPYDLHHWPVLSCHSYQNWTAICRLVSESRQKFHKEKKSDLIFCESKKLLSQPVTILHGPLLGQELLDRVSALEELVAVAPDGVWCVCELKDMSAGPNFCRYI